MSWFNLRKYRNVAPTIFFVHGRRSVLHHFLFLILCRRLCQSIQFLYCLLQSSVAMLGRFKLPPFSPFAGAFARLPKLLLASCLSVCPSVCMEQLGSHRTGFAWNLIFLCMFRKSVEKIQLPIQSDNNNRYCTCRPIYMFDYVSLSSS